MVWGGGGEEYIVGHTQAGVQMPTAKGYKRSKSVPQQDGWCRDLKPENFLLADKSPEALLKATDFGLSVFYKPGQVFRDIVGSAYYVAPEVPPPPRGPLSTLAIERELSV